MTGARDGQRDLRQREFRRFVGWSAGAHLALLGLAVISPFSSSRIDPSQVIAVDLVSLPASALAPSVAPAPAPPKAAPPKPAPPPEEKALPPEPEPPKPKEIVLPKNPEREPSKPKPKPKEVAPQPKPQPEKELEDLLADMRKEAGEAEPAPAPAEQAAAPAPTGVAGAATVAVSPEVLAWMRKAKVHVRGAWVVPPGFRREALETHVVVELDASGAVIGEPKVTQRSGNPWYDESVVRGIQKASPLPPPPSAGEWKFVFLPEDAY